MTLSLFYRTGLQVILRVQPAKRRAWLESLGKQMLGLPGLSLLRGGDKHFPAFEFKNIIELAYIGAAQSVGVLLRELVSCSEPTFATSAFLFSAIVALFLFPFGYLFAWLIFTRMHMAERPPTTGSRLEIGSSASGLASAATAMKSKMKSRFMRITPSLGSLKSVAAKRSLVERRRHGGHCFALASGCG